MIRKLRRKVLLMNMAMISAVLLAVFGLILGYFFQQNRQEAADALRGALALDGNYRLPMLDMGGRHFDENGEPQKPLYEGVTETQSTELTSETLLTDDPPSSLSGNPAVSGEMIDLPPRSDHPQTVIHTFDSTLPTFTVFVDNEGNQEVSGINVEVSDELAQQAVSAALVSGQTSGHLSSLKLRFDSATQEQGVFYAFVDTAVQHRSMAYTCLLCLLIFLGAELVLLGISSILARVALRPTEQAWEQQRQFVADASHELKTPLTVILANSNILASHPDSTIREEQKWVDYIQTEAQRMRGLVEDMLFLAKADQARQSEPFQPVDLSDCVWSCLLPFESVAFEGGQSLDSQVENNLTVLGNAGQLKQLTMILLDNASKYTPKGGSITCKLFAQGEKVFLSVNNQGGEVIPPQALTHLFERFYRSDASRSRDAGGYGLGLSIAETITNAHHGTISVSSTAAEGTTFLVSLPKHQI